MSIGKITTKALAIGSIIDTITLVHLNIWNELNVNQIALEYRAQIVL